MIVSPARAEDLDDIVALERSGFTTGWSREAWASELTAADRYVLVDRDADERVIAVATFQTTGDFADLLRVVVEPASRGQGIARQLLRAGILWAQATGASRMLLEVEDGNDAAQRLYEGAGFLPIDRRADYYGSGRDAVVMELSFLEPAELEVTA